MTTASTTTATIDRSQLATLLEPKRPPCISIYLPTHRPHTQAVQDPTLLRSLLKDARARLSGRDLPNAAIDELLTGADALVDDHQFWRSRTDGLALFGCDGQWQQHWLPMPVEPDVVVGNVVSLRQLAPLFESAGRVLILVVDQRTARLFQADRWSIYELELPELDVPAEDDAARSDVQLRRSSAGPSEAAFFHGHGGTKDASESIRDKFLREVERTVRPLLAHRSLPIVLGGDQAVLAALRQMLHERKILGTLSARPGHLDLQALHDEAWALAAPTVDHAQADAIARYGALAGTGRTSTGAAETAAAAAIARVDVLLLPPHAVVVANGDAPLVDAALLDTLHNSGDVVAVGPEAGFDETAAILRH